MFKLPINSLTSKRKRVPISCKICFLKILNNCIQRFVLLSKNNQDFKTKKSIVWVSTIK